MSMYHVCPDCGASLDVGETCDCTQRQNHTEEKPPDRPPDNRPDSTGGIEGAVICACRRLSARQKLQVLRYAEDLAQKNSTLQTYRQRWNRTIEL